MVSGLGGCLARWKSLATRTIFHRLSSLLSYLKMIKLAKALPNFPVFLPYEYFLELFVKGFLADDFYYLGVYTPQVEVIRVVLSGMAFLKRETPQGLIKMVQVFSESLTINAFGRYLQRFCTSKP